MRFDPEAHVLWIGARFWRADPAGTSVNDVELDGRMTHRHRRCLVRFESGWAASILWGTGSFSSNHDTWEEASPFTEEPSTVEVGVLDHTGELRQRRHVDDDGTTWSDVEAYLDDVELAALLDRLAGLPSGFDYGERPPTVEELTEMMRAFQEAYPPRET